MFGTFGHISQFKVAKQYKGGATPLSIKMGSNVLAQYDKTFIKEVERAAFFCEHTVEAIGSVVLMLLQDTHVYTTDEKLFVYCNGIWKQDPKGLQGVSNALDGRVTEFLLNIRDPSHPMGCKSLVRLIQNKQFQTDLIRWLCQADNLRDEGFYARLDRDNGILPFLGGVWDFQINSFRPARPQDYLTQSIGYAYSDVDTEFDADVVRGFWQDAFDDPRDAKDARSVFMQHLQGRGFHDDCAYVHVFHTKSTADETIAIFKMCFGDFVEKDKQATGVARIALIQQGSCLIKGTHSFVTNEQFQKMMNDNSLRTKVFTYRAGFQPSRRMFGQYPMRMAMTRSILQTMQ